MRETINPYRFAAASLYYRILWDLHPESWRSRKKLRKLKDMSKGKKGLILCNGPSLNSVDFEMVSASQPDVFVFGLNKINLLFDRTRFRPDAVVAVNHLVIEQNADFFNTTTIPLFLNRAALRNVKRRSSVCFLHATHQQKFARDVSVSINVGFTVTFVAMQLAFHFGIRDLALVGCDHNFAIKGPANKTVVSGDKDESHFDSRYFSGGMNWQLPDLSASEYYYAMAGEIFNTADGRIMNCTKGGKLELFSRLPLEDWLKLQ